MTDRRSDNPLESAPRPLLVSFLVLLGVLAYWPVLRVPFMWDDPQMIIANPHITAWTWDNLRHTFTHDVFNQGIPYFRPLQTLLNMVDYSFYGLRPWGYHLTNLLIHLLNIMVLFVVLEQNRFPRASAFWVAGAFAVHPIIVQELMVVAGRAELLSSLFVLLGLWGWSTGKRSGWGVSILCFPLAILSKEGGASLPFLLASVSWACSTIKDRWRQLIPHFALLAIYLALRHHVVGEAVPAAGIGESLRVLFFQAPKILFVYVRLLFVPWHLHSHRYQPGPGWDSLFYLGVALAVVVWGLASSTRRKQTFFWLGWFFSFLLPKIPLLATNSLMLEHWVYLAGVGVYGPVMIRLSKTRFPWVGALPLIFWMGMTQFNIHIRGSDALNYAHSARFSRSPWLRHNWGRDLLMRGHPAEAAILFREVVKRHPEDSQSRNGLAMAYLAMGQGDQAIAVAEEASRLQPSNGTAWTNLSVVYLRTGTYLKALDCARKAMALDPRSVEARMANAECLRVMGRWPEAIDAYRAVLFLNPAQCDARNDLAGLLAQSGDVAGARAEMESILRINPTFPHAGENLNRLARLQSDPPSATQTKQQGVENGEGKP